MKALISVGAAASVGFVLWVGRRNPSLILTGLFVVWVISPFAGLIYARVAQAVTLVVTLGSLAIYGFIALGPPRKQVAFWFLVVPLASWLLILAAKTWLRITARSPRVR